MEMDKLKQGNNIVFIWNKKEPFESANFQIIHKEIVEIFEEAKIVEKY